MATVNKDFRVKHGLVVEGANATVDGSDIITEAAITGGTQTNISVTYDAETKLVSFAAENGVADSDTDDLTEGETNLYYTNQRVKDVLTGSTQTNISITEVEGVLTITAENGVEDSDTDDLDEGETNFYFTDQRALDATAEAYDTAGAAAQALTDAEDYADGLATNYEASGAVSTHSDLTTGVHGVTGDVVGTTDVQALTNKTLGADTSLSEDLDASENKIVNLATPTDAFDAATKAYVDAKAEGLSVKPAVMAATTANLASTYDNGTLGVGSTLTSTSNGAFPPIDGVQLSTLSGQRGLLVKNQTDATQNGRYNLTTLGDENTPWVLTRCGLCDEVTEIPSAYVFVQGGDLYEATGWAAFVENPTTFVVGDDDISWFQFAGAGTYLAGNGLSLDGNTFSIDDTITATKTYVDETFVTLEDLPGELDDYIPLTEKGEADGVATLDEYAQVPLTQLEHVTDIINGFLDGSAASFTEVEINSVAKQVAATVSATTEDVPVVAFAFAKAEYRSAKFLVKVAYSTHTEVSEVLLTLDTSDNIAITEFAVVSTNGSASGISAGISGSNVQLLVTPNNNGSTVTVFGTLLSEYSLES